MKTITLASILRALAVASACVLLLAGVAAAEKNPLAKPSDPKAREYIARGNKLYKLGEFAKAVEEYKAGALEQDAPVFYFNLGQCYRQLGLYKEAIWQYERFLAAAKPTGQLKEAIDGFLVQMKAELEKKAMSQPPLEAAPEPPPPQPAPPREQPAPPAQPVPPPVPAEPAAPWYRDKWGWAIAGTGAAAAGVAGILLVSASDLRDDETPNQDVRDDLNARADRRRLAGILVGIGGTALVATGIIKLALTDAERPAKTAWRFDLHPRGVALSVRF